MKNKYKFSVIVPVYNVENYIAETLDSVINQTIGFKDNIQLIIVNDSSPDNSDAVCKKYRDMYPDNIVYVEKENGGVSSARNKGIEYIEGKYVNFLDSDDKWDLDVFSTVYDFFEKHYDEVDAVSCRVKYFEAKSGYHMLDYKFKKGTRIADLNNPDEYYSIQAFITPVFIKSESIKDLRFDTRMICGEDTVFCTKVILEKCKIGLIEETSYNYRKRFFENSAVDKINYNKYFYNEMLEHYHHGMIDYSMEKFGKVIPYIQAIIACDLLIHCNMETTREVLNDEEFEVYRKKLKELLWQVDDSFIFGQPSFKAYASRAAAINFKYDIDYFKSLVFKDNQLYFADFKVFNVLKSKNHCVLNSVSAVNNKFRIEILVAKWLLRSTANGGKLVLKVGERFVMPKEQFEYAQKTIKTIDGGEYYYASCVFNLKLKLKEGETVQIAPYLVYGKKMSPIRLDYSKFTDGINALKLCRVQGNYVVGYTDGSIRISYN